MIIVFGSISMDLYLDVENPDAQAGLIPGTFHKAVPDGKGAGQALAALRSGAKVALVGKVGADAYGSEILGKLRREGVMTSGVGKSNAPTGINLRLNAGQNNEKTIAALGANLEASADQIPEEILNDKAFVLLQTEIKPEENADILTKAKNCGATTIMNLAPSIDLSQKALNHLDYLIVNQAEAKQLAEKMDMKVEDDALKIAEGLSRQGELNCILTMGARGSISHTHDGATWMVGALDVDKIVDRAGAEDAYCGTLTACLQAGMALPRAMKRASIAGSLACTKQGGQDSFPYLDDIEERINDLDDPKELSA